MTELKRGVLAPQHEDRLRQGTYALLHEAVGCLQQLVGPLALLPAGSSLLLHLSAQGQETEEAVGMVGALQQGSLRAYQTQKGGRHAGEADGTLLALIVPLRSLLRQERLHEESHR